MTLEIVLFTTSFYDFGPSTPAVTLSLSLDHCANRAIDSMMPGVHILDEYISRIDTIDTGDIAVNIAKAISDPRGLSSRLANSIFQYFDFQLSEAALMKWQDAFLTRTFGST